MTGAAAWWIIVVSWNGRWDTLACLDSLAQLGRGGPAVVCVDNGSRDGSQEAVRRAYPDVELIENGRNLGFAGGNNVGIRHALARGARWVVLLNNDATLTSTAIDALQHAALAHPNAGILGGKLLFDDHTGRIWFAGQSFNPALGYSGRPRGYGRPDGPRYGQVRATDRAAGAFMAVSREAIEVAGLLDEELFAYVEDVDWSLRVRAAGFEVLLVPDAVARHRVSSSTGGERGSTHVLYYGMRNTIVVCERHRPLRRRLARLRRWFLLGVFMAQALLLSEGRRPFIAAVWSGYRDAAAGRLGARPD